MWYDTTTGKQKMLATCDICGESIEVQATDLDEVEIELMQLDWAIKKIFKEDVLYICPQCTDFGV